MELSKETASKIIKVVARCKLSKGYSDESVIEFLNSGTELLRRFSHLAG